MYREDMRVRVCIWMYSEGIDEGEGVYMDVQCAGYS